MPIKIALPETPSVRVPNAGTLNLTLLIMKAKAIPKEIDERSNSPAMAFFVPR